MNLTQTVVMNFISLFISLIMEQFFSLIKEPVFLIMLLLYYPFRQWVWKTVLTVDILYCKKTYSCGYSENTTKTIIHYHRIIAMCFTVSCYVFIMLGLKYINHLTLILVTSFSVFISDYITTLCITKNKIEDAIHKQHTNTHK